MSDLKNSWTLVSASEFILLQCDTLISVSPESSLVQVRSWKGGCILIASAAKCWCSLILTKTPHVLSSQRLVEAWNLKSYG